MKKLSIFLVLLMILLSITSVSASEDININQDNYKDYFTNSGLNNVNDGDTLNFESNSDLDNYELKINKNITLTSNTGVILNNAVITLDSGSDGSTVKNLNIINTESAIEVASNNVCLKDNSITITSDYGAYGILLSEVNNCEITNNVFNLNGEDELSAITVDNCENININSNTINTFGSEHKINWVGFYGSYTSLSIFVSNSTNIELKYNNINTKSTKLVDEEFGTIVGVYFEDSDGIVFENNNVETTGFKYAYGVVFMSSNDGYISVNFNNITTKSEYYANGINPQGVTGLISNNRIQAISDYVAYPYYATLTFHDLTLSSNYIYGESSNVYGIEIYNGNATEITGNTIEVKGNYSLGIGIASRSERNQITGNTINTIGTAEGENSCGDAIFCENTGIKLVYESNNNIITNNKITTEGKYSINLADTKNNTIAGNELKSTLGTGETTIYTAGIDNHTNSSDNKTNGSDKPEPVNPDPIDPQPVIKNETIILTIPEIIGYTNENIETTIKISTNQDKTINTGEITIEFLNKTLTQNITNNQATFELTLPDTPGNYSLEAKYTNNLRTVTNKTNVTVLQSNITKEITTILTCENLTAVYGESKNLTGYLKDENGNPIPGQHIQINLTRLSSGANKVYNVVSDYKGEYTLQINLGSGEYSAKAKYEGIEDYLSSESSTSTIIIISNNGIDTSLSIDEFDNSKSPKTLSGTLKTIIGSVLPGQHINLRLTRLSSGASKTYDVVSDYKGIFTLPINLSNGDYTAYCTYVGILTYNNCSTYTKFKVE